MVHTLIATVSVYSVGYCPNSVVAVPLPLNIRAATTFGRNSGPNWYNLVDRLAASMLHNQIISNTPTVGHTLAFSEFVQL